MTTLAWLIEHQQQLTHVIKQGRLPHALLIQGVKGSGKAKLTHWLSSVLTCTNPYLDNNEIVQPCGHCKICLLNKAGNLPDIKQLLPEKNSHKVDDIRAACQYLQKTPQLCQVKLLVISDAHLMNVSASNALLKTLEEPSPSSILILQTDAKSQLLETIISRCQIIDIKPYVGEQLAQQLGANNQDPYLNLPQMEQLTDPEQQAYFETIETSFLQFLQGQFSLTEMAQLIVEGDNGLKYLQQIQAKLIRQGHQWYPSELASEYQQIQQIVPLSSLLTINQLLLELVSLSRYAQSNSLFQTEKFLVSVLQLIKK